LTNDAIADHFSLLSKLLDIHGENSFKSKSYSSAAFAIERLEKPVADMDDAELYQQRGIGQSTGEKIRELLRSGTMEALEQIRAATPDGVIEMMRVKGLGPKKINTVWKEMGIESIGELEYACSENRLSAYKGFGAKTQASILDAIAFLQASQGFHLWAHAEQAALTAITKLREALPGKHFETTGAIRRQEETVDAIDILSDAEKAQIEAVFSTQDAVALDLDPAERLMVREDGKPPLRFTLTSADKFQQALFRTGSGPAFIEAFEARYAIPEDAIDEAMIFSDNGLPYIPPPLRESPRILDLAAEDRLPELIRTGDIRGIIHSHSTWSDGANSIAEMAKAAIAAGYEYLVISDHSQAAQYAGGLTPERIVAQHAEIDALNAELAPFKIFKSIEADILGDGSLDYTPEILASFDLVIASVHSNLRMSQEKAMERILKAVANRYTTILGHPTGRLLLSRAGYPLDHKVLIDTCAAFGVVIEINAHPRRLDIDWRWIEYAVEKGVLLSIDPDAHSVNGYRDVYYGVMSAQKGGLMKSGNLSSFTLAEFEAFVAKRKAGVLD
jgi:DNA polymerase (family 10)